MSNQVIADEFKGIRGPYHSDGAMIYDPEGGVVAQVALVPRGTIPTSSLLAASWDLLQACISVREWLLDTGEPIGRRDLWNEQFLKAHDAVNAAIAKALQ